VGEEAQQVLNENGQTRIIAAIEYRHLFNSAVGGGGILADRQLGFFHSFAILELESETYVLVEKFNDALEMMIGCGSHFCKYARRFRAVGKERPVGPTRPIQEQQLIQIDNVPLDELHKIGMHCSLCPKKVC